MTEVIRTLEMAAQNGYKAYKVNEHDTFGFIVTPNGNILTVNKATWAWGERQGITFTLSYRPNRKCGSGCSCMDEDNYDFGVVNVKAKDLEKYEKKGLKFAHRLKAPRWESVDEWKAYEEKFWTLTEVINNGI